VSASVRTAIAHGLFEQFESARVLALAALGPGAEMRIGVGFSDQLAGQAVEHGVDTLAAVGADG
jgi:hypothetical protein